MMNLIQTYVGDLGHWNTVIGQLDFNHLNHLSADFWPMPHDWATIATKFKDTDISGDIGKWWNGVVKTGQVWAFLLGAIFGYLAKTFTTYG
jgi:hypothetical protein